MSPKLKRTNDLRQTSFSMVVNEPNDRYAEARSRMMQFDNEESDNVIDDDDSDSDYSGSQSEEDEDDYIYEDSYLHRTQNGYAKDGFVVDDDADVYTGNNNLVNSNKKPNKKYAEFLEREKKRFSDLQPGFSKGKYHGWKDTYDRGFNGWK
jgi:hypothetical protein